MNQLVVVLDNIRSAYNTGSLIRSADGVGVKQMIFSGITPLPLDLKVQKTALLKPDQFGWRHICMIQPYIFELKTLGFAVYGLETAKEARSIYEIELPNKTAFIMGNEIKGIAVEIRKKMDDLIQIPQNGVKTSLNVAVAGAIAMYEYLRQQREKND